MSYLELAKRVLARTGGNSAYLADHADAALSRGSQGDAGDPLGFFLADTTIPAAVFHSHALDRDFIMVRNEVALEALTEADHGIPVLFFAEAEMLGRLELEGLRALLNLRAAFGPSVALVRVDDAQR